MELPHGIDNPYIEYRDSLSDQNTDREKYSLILANPPFKGSLDADIVSADLLKMCKTKKTELLFIALFLRMLRVGGRCACIVPDGVLFGSSTAHKAIRKELVEGNRLEAVISMPSGVFKPYAGCLLYTSPIQMMFASLLRHARCAEYTSDTSAAYAPHTFCLLYTSFCGYTTFSATDHGSRSPENPQCP